MTNAQITLAARSSCTPGCMLAGLVSEGKINAHEASQILKSIGFTHGDYELSAQIEREYERRHDC